MWFPSTTASHPSSCTPVLKRRARHSSAARRGHGNIPEKKKKKTHGGIPHWDIHISAAPVLMYRARRRQRLLCTRLWRGGGELAKSNSRKVGFAKRARPRVKNTLCKARPGKEQEEKIPRVAHCTQRESSETFKKSQTTSLPTFWTWRSIS